MNYSVYQNRNMYVASACKTTVDNNALVQSALANVGDIQVNVVGEGKDKQMFFTYKGQGGNLRSDLIKVENIAYAKAVKAADMVTPLKKIKVALDTNVNSGNLVAGQDYILRIVLSQFFGPSSEDQYFKDAAVHATSGMTATQFYAAMVTALNGAFSREVDATATSNPYLAFTSDANGVYITEKAQDFTPGIKYQERVIFDVQPTTIYTGGDDVIWGATTDQTPAKASAVVGTNAIGNGPKLADLEWFCAGERGDQYRGIGYPNTIPTPYYINPANQYNVIELDFAFVDSGVNSYESNKQITIAVPLGAGAAAYTEVNKVVAAINCAVGSTILATLS